MISKVPGTSKRPKIEHKIPKNQSLKGLKESQKGPKKVPKCFKIPDCDIKSPNKGPKLDTFDTKYSTQLGHF